MDWDIGASGLINMAYSSHFDPEIALTRRMENSYPFIGIKLISDVPSGASRNFYALDNDGSNGSVGKFDGFTRNEKWLTMTTPRDTAGVGDVSMIYGLKNLPLLSHDSIRLTFVIAMAESEQLLKQTIDETRTEWLNESRVHTTMVSSNALTATPNPFSSRLHLQWHSSASEAKAFITISDAIGRVVFSQTTQDEELDVAGISLPAGAYFVSLRQGNTVLRGEVISLP